MFSLYYDVALIHLNWLIVRKLTKICQGGMQFSPWIMWDSTLRCTDVMSAQVQLTSRDVRREFPTQDSCPGDPLPTQKDACVTFVQVKEFIGAFHYAGLG